VPGQQIDLPDQQNAVAKHNLFGDSAPVRKFYGPKAGAERMQHLRSAAGVE
jgi:hypothetical protein